MNICPEDVLGVILPAESIPDGSSVTKRTGEAQYILKQGIKVYSDTKGESPLVVDGCFLVSPSGSINQVKPTTLLRWNITAEDLVVQLQLAWEPTPQ